MILTNPYSGSLGKLMVGVKRDAARAVWAFDSGFLLALLRPGWPVPAFLQRGVRCFRLNGAWLL